MYMKSDLDLKNDNKCREWTNRLIMLAECYSLNKYCTNQTIKKLKSFCHTWKIIPLNVFGCFIPQLQMQY